MKHNFHERRQNRKEWAENQIEKNENISAASHQRAKQIASFIPLGQPILVGHHSERRHRSDLKKIDNAMRKSIEASNKAKYYADKAESIEFNDAIFSDDPNALEKLRKKLSDMQAQQQLMKDVNQAIRKHSNNPDLQIEALRKLGLGDNQITTLLTPGFGGVGFASYKLTNNNANIRRVKERIEQMERAANLATDEIEIFGVRIVCNVEANRVQILFPSIPSEKMRAELKARGFRWCRSEGAWQRHLNSYAFQIAKQIVTANQQSNER